VWLWAAAAAAHAQGKHLVGLIAENWLRRAARIVPGALAKDLPPHTRLALPQQRAAAPHRAACLSTPALSQLQQPGAQCMAVRAGRVAGSAFVGYVRLQHTQRLHAAKGARSCLRSMLERAWETGLGAASVEP
jgi:hypothetical protein